MFSQRVRLEKIETRLLPKPGAEIITKKDYPTAEAFSEACRAARVRGAVLIIDDIPRGLV